MSAEDILPLVLKLPRDDQVRLARLALRAAAGEGTDAMAYRAAPPAKYEFASDEEPLAWEGGGWESFDGAR